MELRVSSFCGISRNPDWHAFLQQIAPDLLSELISFLKVNSGCRSARIKMLEIYKHLYERGKGSEFETFVKRRFPFMVELNTSEKVQQKIETQPLKPPTKVPTQLPIKTKQPDDRALALKALLEKHGVFRSYKPEILTFPHKLIIRNQDPNELIKIVKEFLSDKITIDYVIIGDTAYIEYLLTKHKDMESKIPQSSREIAQYKLRKLQ
jgi:hypothetical protein